MRKRIATGLLATAIAAFLLAPTGASAATEFGDNCLGDDTAPSSYTLTTLSAPAGPIPLTAPSAGVITKVRSNLVPVIPFSIPTSVKVMRNAGGNAYTVVNQENVSLGPGISTANVRLPVQPGDRLGTHGLPFTYEGSPIESLTFYCEEQPGSVLGAALGDVPPGVATNFEPVTEGRVPLVATIEPDADGDGYGDETQDLCPQSAAVQTACPVVTLDASSRAGKRAVTVSVGASTAAPVTVTGIVKLGKGKKVTLKAGPKTVAPGKLARFSLKFTSKLKERLKEMEPNQKLTMKITASATNVAGQVSKDKLKAKLKGQG